MNVLSKTPQIGRARRALRVTMLGIRGFPNVQGGVETHAEKLASALAALGCDVTAIVRSRYVEAGRTRWRGVKLVRVWAPGIPGLETFVHTFLGVLGAAFHRPDILHIHAIGPAFFAPLARAFGLPVVVTFHSRNYEHKKWGRIARFVLRLGERAGMTYAGGAVAVSSGLAAHLTGRYRRPVSVIPNGIDPPQRIDSAANLQAFGLAPQRYVLMVARIDEDKRQLDLIAAYARLREPQWKLALVGAADYSGAYARQVADAVRATPGIIMLGHRSGAELAELYSHAGVFVLPSGFEGQPIAVLEAASYGLPVILSDIAAHREIALSHARYFGVGDIAGLTEHLQAVCASPQSGSCDEAECARLMARHDWHTIAQCTLEVYCDALSGTRRGAGAEDPVAARIKELS